MKLHPTERFVQRYKRLPQQIQKKTDKALKFLLQNLRYPSLTSKKYDEKKKNLAGEGKQKLPILFFDKR